MKNINSYFKIGSSHKTCQDYAISGSIEPQYHYGILSDGCSNSLNSDVGSRLLALAAKKELLKYVTWNVEINLYNIIIEAEKNSQSIFSTSYSSCLDATLGFILSFKDKILVELIGDGSIIIQYINDSIKIIDIAYENNSPVYLNYLLDNKTHLYKTQFGNWCPTVSTVSLERKEDDPDWITLCNTKTWKRVSTSNFILEDDLKYEIPIFTKELNANDIKSVSIFSDGISSFMKNNLSLLKIDVLAELLGFKVLKGDFLGRRMNCFFNRFCPQNGISHYDDFSMVSFVNDHQNNE